MVIARNGDSDNFFLNLERSLCTLPVREGEGWAQLAAAVVVAAPAAAAVELLSSCTPGPAARTPGTTVLGWTRAGLAFLLDGPVDRVVFELTGEPFAGGTLSLLTDGERGSTETELIERPGLDSSLSIVIKLAVG